MLSFFSSCAHQTHVRINIFPFHILLYCYQTLCHIMSLFILAMNEPYMYYDNLKRGGRLLQSGGGGGTRCFGVCILFSNSG